MSDCFIYWFVLYERGVEKNLRVKFTLIVDQDMVLAYFNTNCFEILLLILVISFF